VMITVRPAWEGMVSVDQWSVRVADVVMDPP
jgi:hypothetical protein